MKFNLFPEHSLNGTQVIFTQFDDESRNYLLPILTQLRNDGVSAEIYPSNAKLKKQMNYINKKGASFAVLAGSNEIEKGIVTVKNLRSGQQDEVEKEAISQYIAEQS